MEKFKDVFDGLKEKFLDTTKEVKELSPLEQAKLDLKNFKEKSNLEKDVKELRELIKPKPKRRSRNIDRDFSR